MHSNKNVSILLYGHGGSLNHGCEAIIRSTSSLLKREFGDSINITVASFNKQQDIDLCIPNINHYISALSDKRWSLMWIISRVLRKILKQYKFSYKIDFREVISYSKNVDICFSVGGDNYCYGNSKWLYAIDCGIKKHDKKLVLWGCSIEPELIVSDKGLRKDLHLFDLITARESITYDALYNRGINKNLHLHPDPAFTMETEELPLPEGWDKNNMVGINISPLIMKYENAAGVTMKSAYKLVDYILKSTSSSVALILHVNNDMTPLSELYEAFKDSGRVILISQNYNAPQLKGFISRCRFFIGARTHATIAAYSTCVPTLALGYSVKAKGIARDIFGDEKGLVLPIQELSDEKQLINAFEGLREREKELRLHLQKVMPSYIENARSAVKHIHKLLT